MFLKRFKHRAKRLLNNISLIVKNVLWWWKGEWKKISTQRHWLSSLLLYHQLFCQITQVTIIEQKFPTCILSTVTGSSVALGRRSFLLSSDLSPRVAFQLFFNSSQNCSIRLNFKLIFPPKRLSFKWWSSSTFAAICANLWQIMKHFFCNLLLWFSLSLASSSY